MDPMARRLWEYADQFVFSEGPDGELVIFTGLKLGKQHYTPHWNLVTCPACHQHMDKMLYCPECTAQPRGTIWRCSKHHKKP